MAGVERDGGGRSGKGNYLKVTGYRSFAWGCGGFIPRLCSEITKLGM